MTYFQVEQAVHWSGSATAERCGKVEDAQWPIHPVFQFPTSSLWWRLMIRLMVMGQAMCLKNIFFFQTITHGKLTTGSYFRGGGCRATDSGCSPVNCHSPRAAPPPLLCGCWQVVVLSYQGRHASLGPPWGVWCWTEWRWGFWRGPQASKPHQTCCPPTEKQLDAAEYWSPMCLISLGIFQSKDEHISIQRNLKFASRVLFWGPPGGNSVTRDYNIDIWFERPV